MGFEVKFRRVAVGKEGGESNYKALCFFFLEKNLVRFPWDVKLRESRNRKSGGGEVSNLPVG